MQTKTIFIFGNQELEMDSLPLKILPELQKAFPSIHFDIKDPNEEWDVPEKLTIIDTVMGIKKVKVFEDLDSFEPAPHLTMHDFDALANLRYLKKLGKLKEVKVIGVPSDMSEKKAVEAIKKAIRVDRQ
jgi:hypothetical protein